MSSERAQLLGPGLYLHIPFCSAICPYCDFAVRKGGARRQSDAFVGALVDEIRGLRSGELLPEAPDLAASVAELVDAPFDTVYFGGGTPSFLTDDQLERIFGTLFRVFQLRSDCRFFFEANPEDITPEQLQAWRRLGVSTLSLGVQSFDDQELRFLGRRHSGQDAKTAIQEALQAGFETVSVDLIYGLPDQTPDAWQAALGSTLELGADHLSLYELEVHAKTDFGKRQAKGETLQLPLDVQADLFLRTHEILTSAGWDAYEVSNFARTPEHRSRHNQKYWHHIPYLGIGPSAHSFVDGWRFWNERLEPRWRRWVDEGTSPAAGWEKLPGSALALEQLMLGLRTREGVRVERLQAHLDVDFLSQNEQLLASWSSSDLAHVKEDRLVPTAAGMAVADRLAAELDIGNEVTDWLLSSNPNGVSSNSPG